VDFLCSGLRPSLRKSTVFYHKVAAILILFQLAIAICEKIKKAIDEKISGNQNKNPGHFSKTITFFSYPFYKHRRFTKKFYVEDSCIGCGLCEKICPSEAIKIEKGKSVWVKKQCNICLGCLHRCPKESIQYGKKSKTSGRYFYK